MQTSLLPPNATRLERAIEATIGRASAIEDPVDTLNRPATIAGDLLPWLAWQFSVDRWEPDWTEARKRQAITTAIVDHRRKGTPAALERLLVDHDPGLIVVEWFEQSPRATPHTFEIRVPIDGSGGPRSTAAFAETVLRDVANVIPARSHPTMVQLLGVSGAIGIQGVARLVGTARSETAFTIDDSQPWDALLQTEDGEPLQSDDATFLDTRP